MSESTSQPTSGWNSRAISPLSSTTSLHDLAATKLTATLERDIANNNVEGVALLMKALTYIQDQQIHQPTLQIKPAPRSHVEWLGPEDGNEDLGPHNSTIAFAFDIDGVLVRSSDALPGAAATIRMLQRRHIPFILLTNGGGKTEADHVASVGKRLGVTGLHAHQFVQSHSPFHDLVPQFADKTILVLGGIGSVIRDVAHAYGFKNVVTPSDLVNDNAHIYPFLEMTKAYHFEHGKEPGQIPRLSDGRIQIDAIFVWSSSRDSGLDQHLVLDLLLSEKGIVGTVSPKNGDSSLPKNGYLQDGQPPIYYCNPDLTWSTKYHIPRAAQGLFKAQLEGGWAALSNGADISTHVNVFGKPTEATYVYGEKKLQQWHAEIHGDQAKKIKTVYMIGDNPASDIQGSLKYRSNYGSTWKSVLVETGIYVKGTVPAYQPTHIAAGVQEAVELALYQEGYEGGVQEEDAECIVADNTDNFAQG